MAVILPLIGFVAACILVRYKAEYKECVVAAYPDLIIISTANNNPDGMQTCLRIIEGLVFAYSISYFFCIQQLNKRLTTINVFFHEFLHFAFLVTAFVSLGMKGSS